MPLFEMGLPVQVGTSVTPFLDGLHLIWRPSIEVDGFDTRDVGAHAPVDAGTSDAKEYTDVPAGPPGVVALAVSAEFVFWPFDKLSEDL